MKKITVFCGSSDGVNPLFGDIAYQLGAQLAQEDIALIYGGAKIGLMGKVANGAIEAGGKVTGVLPYFLGSKEIAHDQLTEIIMVNTMHDRKMIMHERCEGFIALPGGFGTFEELFEVLTWAQLGLHQKPIGLLNVNGFYNPLIQMVETMVNHGYLSELHQSMLLKSATITDLLAQMKNYNAPEVPKWINKDLI